MTKAYDVLIEGLFEKTTGGTLRGSEVSFEGKIVGHVVSVKSAGDAQVCVEVQLDKPLTQLTLGPFSIGCNGEITTEEKKE
jgi:hypothetical protein